MAEISSETVAGFAALTRCDPDPQVLCAGNGLVVACNPAARDGFPALAPGVRLAEVIPYFDEDLAPLLTGCATRDEPVPGSARFPNGGKTVRMRCHASPVRIRESDDGLVLLRFRQPEPGDQGFVVLRNKIADLDAQVRLRAEAQAALQRAVAEKETLFRELQHRVKNNLQVIIALLRMTLRNESDERVRGRLDDVINRIASVATVQNLLYRTGRTDHVDAGELFGDLCRMLQQSQGTACVSLRASCDATQLGVDVATSLALLTGELVTNAFKHGFPDDRQGEITVALRRLNDDEAELSVSDDGIGTATEPDGGTGTGLSLVEMLTGQLGGSRTVTVDRGLSIAIRFPLPVAGR